MSLSGKALELVAEEFSQELSELHQKYQNDPERELQALLMMALEREFLVTIAYHEELMLGRLEKLSLSTELREILQQALIWIWKDEEMHAIYTRGLLLRQTKGFRKILIWQQILKGAIGGWASSVRHHISWKQAPVSCVLAWCITASGKILGMVPKMMAPYLKSATFAEFCRFHVAAEVTAEMGWRAIAKLGAQQKGAPIQSFARICEDEQAHKQVFQLLSTLPFDQPRSLETYAPTQLAAEIAAIDPWFVPAQWRKKTRASRIANGSPVFCIQGEASIETAFRELYDSLSIEVDLEKRREECGVPKEEMIVAIKTTFMMGYSTRDLSPLISPVLLIALCRKIRDWGAKVYVLESPNLYERFFLNRSVANVASYFGIQDDSFTLIDTSKEQIPFSWERGLDQQSISQTWSNAHYRISLSKMRSHPVDFAYLTLANLESLGHLVEEYLFSDRLACRKSILMMLISHFPPDLAILDAWSDVPDGLVGIMGCRHPKNPQRLYGSKDAMGVDVIASEHMGLLSPKLSMTMTALYHWFGLQEKRPKVIGTDTPIQNYIHPWSGDWNTLLSGLANPVFEYMSNKGAQFVPEMDLQAFPFRSSPSRGLQFQRKMIRRLLGLNL